jgi:hypothetical protein
MQKLNLLNDFDLPSLSNDEEKSCMSIATATTINSGDEGDAISEVRHIRSRWIKKKSYVVQNGTVDSFKQRIHQLSETIRGTIFGEKRSQSDVRLMEAMEYNQVGDEMAKRMNWQEAMGAWKKSLNSLEQSMTATDHRMSAMLLNKIGIVHYVQDSLYFSHECFQKALKIQEAAFLEPGDKDITLTLKNIWIVRVRMMEKTHNSIVREVLMMHVMNSLYAKLLVK